MPPQLNTTSREAKLRASAAVRRPAEPQAPLRQRPDEKSKVLVLALADEYLVPDDESAEQSGGLPGPVLQLLQAAHVLAVDEHLRHRAAPGDRADDARAVAVVESHLCALVAQLLQQRLGPRAVAAALARQDRHLVGLLRPWIEIGEQGVGVGHFERVAGLLGLDEHLLDH